VDHLQKNQIQVLSDTAVAELIEQFHKSDGSPGQFLLNLLRAQCLLGGADSGAILRMERESNVQVLALYPQLESEAVFQKQAGAGTQKDTPTPDWLTRSVGFGRQALSANAVILKELKEPNQSEEQTTQTHVLMIPLTIAEIDKTIASFLITTEDKTSLEACSQRLQLLTGMLGYSQARPFQQNWQQSCQRFQQATETLSAVNQQDKFASAAMAFCNEVASQWQCERVSIGFLKGRYVQLKAMSHTEDFSRKMKVVQDIESVMEECLDQDIEILSPAPKESAYINRAAETLSNRYGPLAILSLPLRKDGKVIAVVTLERPAEKVFSLDEIETVRLACELCTARLGDLYEYDRWIGATIAVKSRNFIASFLGPKHTWAKLASILCFAAILFLIFGKGQFRAEAPFVLEATYQQVIPAPFDGYIKSIEVEISDIVEADTTILGSLDTAELRLKLATAKAEKARYLKEASAAMRDGETALRQIAEANADKVQAQIELLEYEISRADIISPISGVVVKGDLKRQIGAPVKVGDVLFEVCPLESLRAQLLVPEDQIFDIEVGQQGQLATASEPGRRIKFVVERINPVAEIANQRNVFKVRVQLLETYQWMRPGMEGVAKVTIGERRYAWIWSRKIVNWIRMKLWI
jgi:GAF domain-containing protein/biotin carboxyl carrier protein